MAKIQDYNFATFYYLIAENKLKRLNCYDLGENLICSFNSENIDDVIAKVKQFENKLKSGIYTFKCKTSDNATSEYSYNVTKEISFDEVKPLHVKIEENDIEREIRRKIDFENRESELEKRQKEISQKEKMLNGISGQAASILERVGMIIIEKYKPLFMPTETQNFEQSENNFVEETETINGFEENRKIDELFTIDEQNKLVELLKNNEMYLTTVRNMIKN
jgi:hypothetical protein